MLEIDQRVEQDACGLERRRGDRATASPSFQDVTVKMASYGGLVIETTPGALCGAKALLPFGGTVLAADFLTDRKVEANGRAMWVYATPVGGQALRATATFSVP